MTQRIPDGRTCSGKKYRHIHAYAEAYPERIGGVAEEGGTASYFASLPKQIAAKTGTAENPHGRDHGLFVAYGPAESPELVVACIVEQGGFGTSAAGLLYIKFLKNGSGRRVL